MSRLPLSWVISSVSDATDDNKRYLDAYSFLSSGIDKTVSLTANLAATESAPDINHLLELISDQFEQLGIFESFAFYLLPDQLSFEMHQCSDNRCRELIEADVKKHILDGTFGWAVNQNKPIVVTGGISGKQQVLYALATRRRVHGMFIGIASQELHGYYLSIMQLMMSVVSQQFDTIELTSFLSDMNHKLEDKVAQRTRQLEEAKNIAEYANSSKSEFLSRMSHEMRTPMNAIIGYGELLQEDKELLDEEHYRQVGRIVTAGGHLLTIINEVLDLARIDAGKMSLDIKPVALNNIVDSASLLTKPLFMEASITFVNTLENDVFVFADEQSLKQVMVNFLSNAAKYNKEKGTVTVSAEHVGEKNIRIAVLDTGVGIKQDDLKKIFEPFERVGNNKNSIEGSGIGLAITQKLVDAMGGRVGVESVYGHGTNFWLEIAAVAAESECRTLKNVV